MQSIIEALVRAYKQHFKIDAAKLLEDGILKNWRGLEKTWISQKNGINCDFFLSSF
jgi:hypothetical protein